MVGASGVPGGPFPLDDRYCAACVSAIPSHTVVICRGKSCCRQEACAYANLCELLEASGVLVKTVKCLGVCDGPTAGVCIDGREEWFKRLSKKGAQRDLVAVAVGTSTGSKRLDKRMIKGSKRKKVKKKAAKQLAS